MTRQHLSMQRLLCPVLSLVLTVAGCGTSEEPESPALRSMLTRLNAQVVRVSSRIDYVSFEGTSIRDDELKTLRELDGKLRLLELKDTSVTDNGLRLVAGMTRLEALGLSGTQITDEGLLLVSTFVNLQKLYLNDCRITDQGLQHLRHLGSLTTLDLNGTAVTQSGVEELRNALPECDIRWQPSAGVQVEPTFADNDERDKSSGHPHGLPGETEPEVVVNSVRVKPPQSTPAVDPAADIYRSVSINWTTPFGDGGAVLPRLQVLNDGTPEAADEPLNRIVGAVFDPESGTVTFLGVRQEGWPEMLPEDLTDGLAVAVQSHLAGDSPGVSFESTPEQRGTLRDGDLNGVDYFGTARNTIVGWAAYEADRTMKCLGGGRDTISGQPVSSSVEGFMSQIELRMQGRTAGSSQERFWIEPTTCTVRHSPDGLTVMADIKLEINTRKQAVVEGRRVDAASSASPDAMRFAQHMTDHYFEYAAEFPSLAMVYNFSVLSSIADAITSGDSPLHEPLTGPSFQWLADHQPRHVDTPDQTPVIVVEESKRVGNVTRTVGIVGGVTMNPKNRFVTGQTPLTSAVRKSRSSLPSDVAYVRSSMRLNDSQYSASWTVARRRRRAWQVDLDAGRIRLTRHLNRTLKNGVESDQWELQHPRIRFGRPFTNPDPEMSRWTNVQVTGRDGSPVTLTPCIITSPLAEGPVRGYKNKDGSVTLALFSNKWIQTEQPVRYGSINGGPVQRFVEGNGRCVEFSAGAGHHVERVLTSNGEISYQWNSGRLESVRSGADQIQLEYDPAGRLNTVRGAGKTVNYRYDDSAQLREVTYDGKPGFQYDYDSGGRLIDIELPQGSSAGQSELRTAQVRVRERSSAEIQQRSEKSVAKAGLNVISVSTTADGQIRLTLNGQQVIGEAASLRDLTSNRLQEAVRSGLPQDNAGPIVVTGGWKESSLLNIAIRRALPDRFVTTTDDLTRAQKNLADGEVNSVRPRLVTGRSKLLDRVESDLAMLPAGAEGDPVVIFSGHNDRVKDGVGEVSRQLLTMAEEGSVRNSFVFLNTCGDANMAAVARELVAAGDAKGVIAFAEPIPQLILAPLAAEVQRRVGETDAPLSHAKLQQIMRESVNEMIRKARDGELPRSLSREVQAGSNSDSGSSSNAAQDSTQPQGGNTDSILRQLSNWFFLTECRPCERPRRQFGIRRNSSNQTGVHAYGISMAA